MRKEIIKHFLGKFVRLEKRVENLNRPFNLYGTIEEVTDEYVLIQTDRLTTVQLENVVGIRETVRKFKGGRNGY